MNAQHYTIIAGIVASIAMELAGVKHWQDAMTPAFVSGVILQISTGVGALFVPKVGTGPAGAPPPLGPVPVQKDAA